jgi:hypothetical protein
MLIRGLKVSLDMSIITVQELKSSFNDEDVIFCFAKKMNGLFITSENELFQNIMETNRFTVISKTRIRNLETDTETNLNGKQQEFIKSIIMAVDSFYERITSS